MKFDGLNPLLLIVNTISVIGFQKQDCLYGLISSMVVSTQNWSNRNELNRKIYKIVETWQRMNLAAWNYISPNKVNQEM